MISNIVILNKKSYLKKSLLNNNLDKNIKMAFSNTI